MNTQYAATAEYYEARSEDKGEVIFTLPNSRTLGIFTNAEEKTIDAICDMPALRANFSNFPAPLTCTAASAQATGFVYSIEDINEQWFRWLAQTMPRMLISMIEGGTLKPSELTFAAEIAGEIANAPLVVPCLRRLLNAASPLVREGAIYGLAHHLDDEVRSILMDVATVDPSPGVRSAAQDLLD